MKISIIGGAGRVGSNAAYALQLGGVGQEIALVDVAQEAAHGEALDLRHGASLAAPQKIYAGGYEAVEDSDMVMITAGLRRKPDESRLELINRNVSLFKDILAEIKQVKLAPNCILFVVANPVDILTCLACQLSGFPSQRVIGLGTMLDTARFRSLLGEHFGVDQTQVEALILGEHGDSMVPIWSSAAIAGVPLKSYPGYSQEAVDEVFEETKKSGAEVIRLKGGAGYAVGLAIREVVEAIVEDRKSVLPISSWQQGAFGMEGVCLSLPTILSREGVEKILEIPISAIEQEGLLNSAQVLKETMAGLG